MVYLGWLGRFVWFALLWLGLIIRFGWAGWFGWFYLFVWFVGLVSLVDMHAGGCPPLPPSPLKMSDLYIVTFCYDD